MEKVYLKSLTENQLKEFVKDIGEKPFRATQIFSWLYKGVESFDEMNNLSKSLREKLSSKADIGNIKIYKKFESKIDETIKYLFALEDGNIIESVMMKYKHGVSVCISTQVGCRMGCSFCASTIDGLERNLKSWEIIDQVLKIQKDIGQRVSNIVLMGSGEPLDNFDEVKKFLEIVNEKNGLNIGYRHITLSTCGIVPKIYELSDLKLPINLAISLHAPDDEKRKEIMPIGKSYSINEIIKACKYYIKNTNRRVTFEYSLIKGFNDTKKDVKLLGEKLKGLLCHVNLIPINKVEERNFEKPNMNFVYKFRDELKNKGIAVTIRREMGSDIEGACGQLRRKHL
ncbi:23S rRNA (adenine(2503)-C(2))-methyltransferase RlmN [Tepidibacter formicigenes]|jgi:23S rRNA (adenine2503-C2)-methyltransferase|uniref:Probable dual-specificity RNA methyltransferase RlmN n=1 Tax=Tepidibacter formicigenes DSM 15518 TaxID=1123349 RepID=A0A1M6KH87_9FIRM|nr:23S rRNA (adenine(2503)-C(2))-methyltransferase RlmN [Tepidibacter formicigenes]SHJ58305.1 23S rRNA (adenine2503-C2)-methyltransferase [Tepidibacter formicigenes DSM 15518]